MERGEREESRDPKPIWRSSSGAQTLPTRGAAWPGAYPCTYPCWTLQRASRRSGVHASAAPNPQKGREGEINTTAARNVPRHCSRTTEAEREHAQLAPYSLDTQPAHRSRKKTAERKLTYLERRRRCSSSSSGSTCGGVDNTTRDTSGTSLTRNTDRGRSK